MTKSKRPAAPVISLQRIKELAVIGMFSDDTLLEMLALKGGNALDLIYRMSTRSSVDVDLSMARDFPGGIEPFRQHAEAALTHTYAAEGLLAFDFKIQEKPGSISEDLKSFWGGYGIEFKLLPQEKAKALPTLEDRRRNAINLGQGTRFLIDVSAFEYLGKKVEKELDGYQVFVYSLPMIVAEKLRALCQQLPAYAPIVKRMNRPGSVRAKDFVDIHLLVTQGKVDMNTKENVDLLRHVFSAKRVPLDFLRQIRDQRAFHASGFDAVRATVKPGEALSDFDFYFDFVMDLIGQLETAGHI